MNFVLNIFSLIVQSSLVVAPIYLLVKQWRWSRSISAANSSSPWSVRTIEVIVLAVLVSALVLHIATGGIGMSTAPLPTGVIRERALICAVIVAVATLWIVLAFRRSITLGSAGIITSALIGTLALSLTNAMSYERFESEIRKIPIPVEISLSENVSDVDVFVNGVRMGQAPLQTTIEDIEAKAPGIEYTDDDHRQEWKNFQGGTYMPKKKISIDRAERVRINVNNPEQKQQKLDLVLHFERKGEPLLVSGNMSYSSGSRMFGQIRPARIPVNVMTEQWDHDVTLLLERARLLDYHVDTDWIAAADTYFDFVRTAILNAIPGEPELEQVLTGWARSRYQLDQATDANSAWKVFETIRDEANRMNAYNTSSIAGNAVELLLDKLDVNRVITAAAARLSRFSVSNTRNYAWGWGSLLGKPYFTTSTQPFSTIPDPDVSVVRPGDFVLAHAVWKLDQRWNAEGLTQDNPVEDRIAPKILQLGYGVPNIQKLAFALGGSKVEEFERRQERRIENFQPSTDFSENEFIEGEQVNRPLWQSINAVGAMGAHFRNYYVREALELAERLSSRLHVTNSIPDWMGFLFLDVEGRDPLARDFWKSFQNKVQSDDFSRMHLVNLDWSYLSRIRPLPDVSEFATVFLDQDGSPGPFFNPNQALASLPAVMKYEIAVACIERAEKSQSTLTPNSMPYVQLEQARWQLIRYIAAIPLNEAAEFTISRLNPAKLEREQADAKELIRQLGNQGKLTGELLSRLAVSTEPKQRLWVIPQIRLSPTRPNREILARLQKDDDKAVRESANTVARQLDELRRQPLPKLH